MFIGQLLRSQRKTAVKLIVPLLELQLHRVTSGVNLGASSDHVVNLGVMGHGDFILNVLVHHKGSWVGKFGKLSDHVLGFDVKTF